MQNAGSVEWGWLWFADTMGLTGFVAGLQAPWDFVTECCEQEWELVRGAWRSFRP